MVIEAADAVVEAKAQEAFGVLTTDSLCAQTDLTMERTIPSLTGRYFYVMHVSKKENSDAPDEIFFKIAPRKDPENIIAAKFFSADVKFRLFNWDVDSRTLSESDESITIDPQSVPPPIDAVSFVKEVFGGKKYFYVIPCSTSAGMCELNRGKVGKIIESERGVPSTCLPPGS